METDHVKIVPLTTIEFTEHPELFDRPSPETDAAWDALMPSKSREPKVIKPY